MKVKKWVISSVGSHLGGQHRCKSTMAPKNDEKLFMNQENYLNDISPGDTSLGHRYTVEVWQNNFQIPSAPHKPANNKA